MERATLVDTFEFVNLIRAAGGADPVDALMPGVPMDPSRCLLANNLNFDCRVRGGSKMEHDGREVTIDYEDGECAWFMFTNDDKELSNNLAAAVGSKAMIVGGDGDGAEWAVLLPQQFAMVARDFDAAMSQLRVLALHGPRGNDDEDPPDMDLIREMLPYIDKDWMVREHDLDEERLKNLLK